MVGTKEQYLERIKGYKQKAFVGGERVKDLLTDPNTRTIVNTVAKTYELACDPERRISKKKRILLVRLLSGANELRSRLLLWNFPKWALVF